MFIEDLDDLVSGQPEKMRAAFGIIAPHTAKLGGLDARTRRDFRDLGRHLGEFEEWPDSEQRRFCRLAIGIRTSFMKHSVFDKNGNIIWPDDRR